MKSGLDRDRISEESQLVAFEMEASGLWNNFPTILVKSVCDYADSHKNKEWQPYAAATSAAGLKALLERRAIADETLESGKLTRTWVMSNSSHPRDMLVFTTWQSILSFSLLAPHFISYNAMIITMLHFILADLLCGENM